MKYGSAILNDVDRRHRQYEFQEGPHAGRHVVVWSGGYDSTLVLAEVARRYSASASPVVAVVIQSQHLDDRQAAMEEKARAAFLTFAESRGWSIHVAYSRIESRATDAAWTVHATLPQAVLWFHAVLPYLCSNDKVYWGYIEHDDYWVIRDRLVRAMEACTAAAFISGVSFEYPLAGADKSDVVRTLREHGVPLSTLWTCDNPRDSSDGIVPCQKCKKCKAVTTALEPRTTIDDNAVEMLPAALLDAFEAERKAQPKVLTATGSRARALHESK